MPHKVKAAGQEARVGIVLLAAGSSSRMGRSKQLLPVHGEPLLAHAAQCAVGSGMHPVVVVLGANESAHRVVVARLNVEITVNEEWKRGIGSSLKAGLKYLQTQDPTPDAVLVMVCDQPLMTSDHLAALNTKYKEGHRPIVATSYSGTAGVPALFDKSLFEEILQLEDDDGARKLIQRRMQEADTVDFPAGSIDLDTPEDYQRFTQ